MDKTEIFTPANEPALSVWLSCPDNLQDVQGYAGMCYLESSCAHIVLAGAKGLSAAVLAHEAVHAAVHLIRISWLRPKLGISWNKAIAPKAADAHEETLAWLVEQITAGGIRAVNAWEAKQMHTITHDRQQR